MILTPVTMINIDFWVVMLCSLVYICRRFRRTYCHLFQGRIICLPIWHLRFSRRLYQLRCDVMLPGRCLLTFRRFVLLPLPSLYGTYNLLGWEVLTVEIHSSTCISYTDHKEVPFLPRANARPVLKCPIEAMFKGSTPQNMRVRTWCNCLHLGRGGTERCT
jgi:hypothetical protein